MTESLRLFGLDEYSSVRCELWNCVSALGTMSEVFGEMYMQRTGFQWRVMVFFFFLYFFGMEGKRNCGREMVVQVNKPCFLEEKKKIRSTYKQDVLGHASQW